MLWFLNDDSQLVPNAKATIEDPANRKFVSLATCWEIAVKVGLKKLDLGESASVFLPRELSANKFDLLRIELTHVMFIESLPIHHKDPFDRLLIAQSLLETMQSLAKTLRRKRDLLLNWFRAGGALSSGVVEGFNNKLKLITRKSYGFRNQTA